MNIFYKKQYYILSLFVAILMISAFNACQKNPYSEGEILYKKYCSNCHMDDGSGLGTLIPPLANADFLRNADLGIVCIIKNGISGPMIVNDITYDNVMPANAQLSNVEIVNIANYIHNSWGNKREFISLDQVKSILSQCQK